MAAFLLAVSGCSAGVAGSGDAEAIVDQIARMVPSARKTMAVVADNGSNHVLCRPDACDSQADFADSRLPPDTNLGGLHSGGTVEVFADGSRARTRLDHLRHTGMASAEYDYESGPAVLRLSPELRTDQAAEYAAAFMQITE